MMSPRRRHVGHGGGAAERRPRHGRLVDQNVAEGLGGGWVKHLEDGAEVGLSFVHLRGCFNASRAASTDA